jgi:hypothetical protein
LLPSLQSLVLYRPKGRTQIPKYMRELPFFTPFPYV